MQKKRLNILHLRDSPSVCGPDRTILETATIIDKTKYNYIVGGFAGPEGQSSPLIKEANLRNLNVFSIKETSSFDAKIISQTLNYIDKNNIHLVHTHETRSDILGLICAKRKKIRLATTLHGWISNDLKSLTLNCLDKFILHFFDLVVVVSEKMKHQILKYKIPKNKIHVLRNSIVIDHFTPNKEEKIFRKEFNISSNTILIGNIGRLSPEKGQADFILAAAEIIKKNYNVKFVLIGIGPDEEKLKKIVKIKSISDSIIFTGYRKDMQQIYNSLDLVIQSSYTEGMPNVILESLLMEKTVIATDVGGTSEIIKNNITGILVKAGDFKLISSKIEQFLNNIEYYRAIANIGREHVKNEFNFNCRTKKLTELYENLLKIRITI